ncbi:MAG: caspase family protein [Chitinophagaceae bacterium]|nr:caspase family protein [Chitinophagaceae bacterium]
MKKVFLIVSMCSFFYSEAQIFILKSNTLKYEDKRIESLKELETVDVTESEFTAKWEVVKWATGYVLDVSTNRDKFDEYMIPNYKNLSLIYNNKTISRLKPSTQYYYRVSVLKENNVSDPSPIQSVKTKDMKVPTLNEPKGIGSNDFTIQWNMVEGALSYQIDISTDDKFTNIQNSYPNITGEQHTVYFPTPSGTYYYRIKAMNQDISTDYSRTKKITLEDNVEDITNLHIHYESAENAIAVIIGNKNYENNIKAVEYAINDAQSIKNYVKEVMGFSEENILYKEDAISTDFIKLFGNEKTFEGSQLYKRIKKGESKVFIFYAGHGAPSTHTKENYFIPVDADILSPEILGYSMKTFERNISRMPAKSITIVLDACFSGINMPQIAEGISGFKAIPLKIENSEDKIWFASSSGEQASTWYEKKQHGTFTYYFLKGIQSKATDENKDGNVTYKELQNYLIHPDNVTYTARILHNIEQTPQVQASETMLQNIFFTYKNE